MNQATISPQCLIIDDEPDILETLCITLERMRPAVECSTATCLAEAYQKLNTRPFQLCLTDMRLPDGNGLDFIQYMQQNYPHIPVAMITAHGNMETAITALKSGAFDFISKPVELKQLRQTVQTALNLPQLRNNQIPSLLGDSPVMQNLKRTIHKLARSQAPAYISGESGTGKELVARLIHAQGARKDKPFVPVNCGAIPYELMESEFFGHKKGSFTGAVNDKQGLFQAAEGGTLFLDEVADLPLNMQVKLLRAIQEKRVRPVGAHTEIAVDVRILSATHKNLNQLVQEGSFRQDLFYRINVIEIPVPPLRERGEDIPLLIQHLLENLYQKNQASTMGEQAPKISNSALDVLKKYPFPGNVRELENILERAQTLCESDTIQIEDLQLPKLNFDNAETSGNQGQSGNSLDPMLDNVEKETILKALEQTHWNKTKAAELLGVTFSTLRYRLKKLKLDKI